MSETLVSFLRVLQDAAAEAEMRGEVEVKFFIDGHRQLRAEVCEGHPVDVTRVTVMGWIPYENI